MKKILGMLILLASSTTLAAIYVNQTANGGTEFTDTPNSTSTPLSVPPVNSITSVRPAAPQSTNNKQTAGSATSTAPSQGEPSSTATYTTFEITSPKDQETLTNQPVIPVQLNVEPNMKPGDKIQLLLDGSPAGTPTGTIYQELGLVERGTHTLGAVIMNSKGESIKQSATITIFVQRNSTILSPAMQKPRTN